MVKFDRQILIELLEPGEDIEILIKGKMGDQDLYGTGLLTAFYPPREKDEDEWNLIYSTDFSEDPPWVTNNPARYYWISSTETYKAIMYDNTDEYAYIEIPYQMGSFRFEYDMIIEDMNWAANFHIGLWDD